MRTNSRTRYLEIAMTCCYAPTISTIVTDARTPTGQQAKCLPRTSNACSPGNLKVSAPGKWIRKELQPTIQHIQYMCHLSCPWGHVCFSICCIPEAVICSLTSARCSSERPKRSNPGSSLNSQKGKMFENIHVQDQHIFRQSRMHKAICSRGTQHLKIQHATSAM